jgi:hypothetical protein
VTAGSGRARLTFNLRHLRRSTTSHSRPIEKVLVSELQPGDIMIMDNLSSHQRRRSARRPRRAQHCAPPTIFAQTRMRSRAPSQRSRRICARTLRPLPIPVRPRRHYLAQSARDRRGVAHEDPVISSMAIVTPDRADSRKLFIDALGCRSSAMRATIIISARTLAAASISASGRFRRPPKPVLAGGSANTASLHRIRSCRPRQRRRGRAGAASTRIRAAAWCAHRTTGQTVARMLTAEGVILGISYAPWMHQS